MVAALGADLPANKTNDYEDRNGPGGTSPAANANRTNFIPLLRENGTTKKFHLILHLNLHLTSHNRAVTEQ